MPRIAIKRLEQQVRKNLQILFGLLFTRTVETNLDTPDKTSETPSKPWHPHEL